MHYTGEQVEASASAWAPQNESDWHALAAREEEMKAQCARRGVVSSYHQGANSTLKSGGWCLGAKPAARWQAPRAAGQHSIPGVHVPADEALVDALLRYVLRSPEGLRSINDFGAGVGQYGHSLLAREPSLRYRGYDGAGDVREYTDGFVKFVDLTMPLSLPRADWVLSMEVGEHVPHEHEMMFVRNLHAHNCRGLVLSWAQLEQLGTAHVNTHSLEYVLSLFSSLGYSCNRSATHALRRKASFLWLRRNLVVFDRMTPTCL